jgi:hypothetical protein
VPLVAAAVCPHPPLLVPEVAAGAAAELDDLRRACRAAVSALAAADAVLVVGAGTHSHKYNPPVGGSLTPWGVDLAIGQPGGEKLPLSLLIGAWLLPGASGFVSVAGDAPAAECVALGQALAAEGRIGLLVMGDGSARRSEKAPGYLDPRAEPFDRAVATALAKADADALSALDPELAAELLVAGRAPWQVLAGAGKGAGELAGEGAGGNLTGELLYDAAPYGVGYLVASWR